MEEKEKDLSQPIETTVIEATERAERIEEKASKLMEEKQIQSADSIDVLYYAGCTASYDINVKEVGINTLNILDAIGIKFGILGAEEKCWGSPFLRIGDYEFERLAEYNIRLFNSLNVKMLITACAGCYRTISVDYKKMGTSCPWTNSAALSPIWMACRRRSVRCGSYRSRAGRRCQH